MSKLDELLKDYDDNLNLRPDIKTLLESSEQITENTLNIAVLKGQAALVNQLLALGAKPNEDTMTCVLFSGMGLSDNIVKKLLEAGASVGKAQAHVEHSNFNPVIREQIKGKYVKEAPSSLDALEYAETELSELREKYGPFYGLRRQISIEDAFAASSKGERLEQHIAQRIAEAETKLSNRKSYYSPLDNLLKDFSHDNIGRINALLAEDPDAQITENTLNIALLSGYGPIVEKLLEHGAEPNEDTLTCALFSAQSPEIFTKILDAGAVITEEAKKLASYAPDATVAGKINPVEFWGWKKSSAQEILASAQNSFAELHVKYGPFNGLKAEAKKEEQVLESRREALGLCSKSEHQASSDTGALDDDSSEQGFGMQ